MKNLLTAAAALVLLSAAQTVSAQEIRGFAYGSGTTAQNDQHYPGFGGGVVFDLGQPWLAVGAQGEAFSSWPYFAGRGSVFAEGRLMPNAAIRPIVLGGAGFGQYGGPMFGGGVEIRVPRSRLAVRMTVEDYVRRDTRYSFTERVEPMGTVTSHQVATRFGVSF